MRERFLVGYDQEESRRYLSRLCLDHLSAISRPSLGYISASVPHRCGGSGKLTKMCATDSGDTCTS